MNTPHIKPPKIWVNAEFQRLLWLNLSWGMIAGVAIIYALFAFAKYEYRAWHDHLASIGGIGLMLSAIAGFVLVERSLKNDIAANAFDQLRMSALSPWQMTYSRIIAAPTVAWAGFVIGWLMVGYGVFLDNHRSTTATDAVCLLLMMPFCAWAFACVVVANALQFGRSNRQYSGTVIQLILAFVVWSVFMSDSVDALRAVFPYDLESQQYTNPYYSIDDVSTPFTLLISSVITALLASIAVRAIMAWKLHLQSPRFTLLLLAMVSPIVYFWAAADKNVLLFLLAQHYALLGFLSLVTQDNRYFGKWASWREMPVWLVALPLAMLASALLGGGALLAPFMQILLFAAIALLCGNILSLRYNAVTLALSVFLLLRGLWAMLH